MPGLVVHRHGPEVELRQVAAEHARARSAPRAPLRARSSWRPSPCRRRRMSRWHRRQQLHQAPAGPAPAPPPPALQQARTRVGAHLHARPRFAHALARTADDLPARGLALAEDPRDVVVAGIEYFVQQKRCSLFGSEPLEQSEEGHREARSQLGGVIGGRRRFSVSGSGSHGPTYLSRSARNCRNRSMHRRVVAVISHALGERISPLAARFQRSQASCTMSSASAREPSIR